MGRCINLFIFLSCKKNSCLGEAGLGLGIYLYIRAQRARIITMIC